MTHYEIPGSVDINRGLVGYWKLDDAKNGSSVAIDRANFNDGTITGACLVGDTMIKTSEGLKRVDEIEKGDVLYSCAEMGMVEHEVSELILNGIKDVYKLKTSNRTITATDNHPFLIAVYKGKKKRKISYNNIGIYKNSWDLEWKELKDINEGDIIVAQSKDIINNKTEHSLDFMKFVGCFLGDGGYCVNKTNSTVSLALYNDELIQKYSQILTNEGIVNYNDGKEVKFHRQEYMQMMRDLDLNHNVYNKRVPSWVWELDNEHKKSLLEGMIDSDCWKQKNMKDSYGLQLVNKMLLEDIRQLSIDVGYAVTNVLTRPPRDSIQKDGRVIHGKKSYCFNFRINNTKYPNLRSGNKRVNVDVPSGFEIQKICSIEYVGEQETYDVVMPTHHNFIANGLLVHNTNTTGINGLNADAMFFDGVDDVVISDIDSNFDFTKNFSIKCSFKINTLPSNRGVLISDEKDPGNKRFRFFLKSNGKLEVVNWFDGATARDIEFNHVFNIGEWYTVVLNIDRETDVASLYVNGIFVPGGSISNWSENGFGTVTNWTFGCNRSTENWFNGTIQTMRLYDRILTAGEASKIARLRL